ncbi:MAG: hypothetical protein LBP53_04200 [Candidatus Peribacteria bacterium]|nr:hypothetical protein [Candidatus Peribacteria bacterium]
MTGTITYDVSLPTSGTVQATLTTNKPVVPITGWIGETGTVFTRVFTANTHGNVVFTDAVGNLGTALYAIDWIDTTAPQAQITYTPNQQTT